MDRRAAGRERGSSGFPLGIKNFAARQYIDPNIGEPIQSGRCEDSWPMRQIAGRKELERVTQILGFRRPPEDPLRTKLMGRLATLSELFRDAATVETATAAIGWAALMLTGASRSAVFIRTQDGAVSCPWSLSLSNNYLRRLCTPGGHDSWAHLAHHPELASMDLAARGRARSTTPSIVEDISTLPAGNETRHAGTAEGIRAFCSWPLGRGGRVFGAAVYFFDTPHVCSDQEREVVLAFASQASAVLEAALAAEAGTQAAAQSAVESDAVVAPDRVAVEPAIEPAPAAATGPGIPTQIAAPPPATNAERSIPTQITVLPAAAETRHSVQTQIGAPPSAPTQHEVEAVIGHLLALRRALQAEADRLETDWTNIRAERERLAAARREVDAECARLAGVRRVFEEEQRRTRMRPGAAPELEAAAGERAEHSTVMDHRTEEKISLPGVTAAISPAVRAGFAEGSVAGEPAGAAKPATGTSVVAPNKPKPAAMDASTGAAGLKPTKPSVLERAYLGSVEKYRHRVMRWTEATAVALRFSVNDIAEMREAVALLYDVRASFGRDLPLSVAAILRHRSEHWDGTGKPDGLNGNAIPLGARLLAVTLAYAEMVIGRPGAPMLYYLDAKAALRRDAGTRFDPNVVTVFCGTVDRSSGPTKVETR
jgi:HD domain